MDGLIPSENMRFRDYTLSFNISEKDENDIRSINSYTYGDMVKTFETGFKLEIQGQLNHFFIKLHNILYKKNHLIRQSFKAGLLRTRKL